MDNGNDVNVIKQFDKIAFLPDKWDHNQQYQKYLLKNMPKNCNRILDAGCGTGELTKKLTHFSKEIIGIDVSENMINEAKKRNYDERIDPGFNRQVQHRRIRQKPQQGFCILNTSSASH
jgi:ubiquinone/menaquinone biosynthesis C-methylase UbiE